jgi:hypothetical protein
METIWLTRKELYDLVWSLPISALSELKNIPTSAIWIGCKKLKIPLPVPGHWQKVKHGNGATPTPLSTDYEGEYSFGEGTKGR